MAPVIAERNGSAIIQQRTITPSVSKNRVRCFQLSHAGAICCSTEDGATDLVSMKVPVYFLVIVVDQKQYAFTAWPQAARILTTRGHLWSVGAVVIVRFMPVSTVSK